MSNDSGKDGDTISLVYVTVTAREERPEKSRSRMLGKAQSRHKPAKFYECRKWCHGVPRPHVDSSRHGRHLVSRRALIAGFISLLVGFAGCASVKDQYLEGATGKATQDEIIQMFGHPTEERESPTGGQVWLYRFIRYSPVESANVCDEYQLQFDVEKILRTLDRFICGDLKISYESNGWLTQ